MAPVTTCTAATINGLGGSSLAGTKLSLKPSRLSFRPTSYRGGPVVAKYGNKSVYFDLENLGNTTGQLDVYDSDAPSPYNPLQLLVPSNSSTKLKLCNDPKVNALQHLKSASLPLSAALALPFLLNPQYAFAAGGEFGILEGRSLALIHPIVMGGLFTYTLYAGYLGWQWRRVRTLQDEINELKKQDKQLVAATATATTTTTTPAVEPNSPLEPKIQQLSEERKELIKGQYREKHFNAGSILLAFGVFESIGGGVNTYLRTGKLFPGPHLYAGAAITVLWAVAAALVPPMQKGNESARNLHIALNMLNILLFISQILTGWDIVLKVFEFTKWP